MLKESRIGTLSSDEMTCQPKTLESVILDCGI